MIDDLLEVRRVGMQPFRIFLPGDTRGAMTVRAAMCCECFSARLHHLRIVYVGGRLVGRVPIDRRRADLDQCPADYSRILRGARHAVKAAKKKHCGADPHNYCERADKCKKPHKSLHGTNFNFIGAERYTGLGSANVTLS